jgi:chromosome segregation ATPase
MEGEMEEDDFPYSSQLNKIDRLQSKSSYENLPLDVTKSKAIDALIQQNDDLMARLSVGLRRISSLEEQLDQTTEEKKSIQNNYDSLKDQVLILKQKTASLAGRRDNTENVIRALKDKALKFEENLKVSEIRYAELSTNLENKQNQLLKRIDQYARRMRRYLIYRERVQKASKFLRAKHQEKVQFLLHQKHVSEHNLNQELSEIKKKMELEHSKIQDQLIKDKIQTESHLIEKTNALQERLDISEKHLSLAETSLKDLREKLSQSTDYIQNNTKAHKEELIRIQSENLLSLQRMQQENENELFKLKEQNKNATDKFVAEIEKLQRENQKLFDKCIDLEKVYEENVQLQNKIIFTERVRDEQRSKYQDEIDLLQRNLSHYRAESKSKSSEVEKLRAAYEESEKTIFSLKEDKLKLEDQTEATQNLWRDSQREIEALKEKVNSLQSINQQLSSTINQSRKDHRSIKEKFDILNDQMSQKFKELKRSSDTLNTIREIESGANDPEFSPELTGKIETLIAEIQSGFIKK